MAKINKDDLKIGITFTRCRDCERVEVVRCKDCKHSKDKPIIGRLEEGEQTALLYCTMFVNGQHIYGDDFCSYGERRTECHE